MAENHVCASCGQPEDEESRRGAEYEARSDRGTAVRFWMCNRCAIPLGPAQGPADLGGPEDEEPAPRR